MCGAERDFQAPGAGRWELRRSWPVWLLAAGLAVGLRLAVAGHQEGYDLASYRIVADLVHHGKNVYASTARYNYGPVWFHLLGGLRWLAQRFPDPYLAFGYAITAFLSLVDLALGALLLRRFGPGAALYFLLHPVSIIISGYHRQFGSVALLLGFLAALAFERAEGEDKGVGAAGLGSRRWTGLAALSASLVVKHALFAFPFWLAVRQRTRRGRLLVLFVPPAIFFASFVPYLGGGEPGESSRTSCSTRPSSRCLSSPAGCRRSWSST